jgi:hypothetical protein
MFAARTPGFTAESSVYRSSGQYRISGAPAEPIAFAPSCPGQLCGDPNIGFTCCQAPRPVCCFNPDPNSIFPTPYSCCPSSDPQCCQDPNTGPGPCPGGALMCGNRCCPRDEYCGDTRRGICCPESTVFTVDGCCPPGQVCDKPSGTPLKCCGAGDNCTLFDGCCPKENVVCNGHCCQANAPCSPVSGCCQPGEILCGDGRCCSKSTLCTVEGCCLQPAHVTNGHCCQEPGAEWIAGQCCPLGYVYDGRCCPHTNFPDDQPATPEGCCPRTRLLKNGHCCPIHQVGTVEGCCSEVQVSNGHCCPSGQSWTNGRCCASGQIGTPEGCCSAMQVSQGHCCPPGLQWANGHCSRPSGSTGTQTLTLIATIGLDAQSYAFIAVPWSITGPGAPSGPVNSMFVGGDMHTAQAIVTVPSPPAGQTAFYSIRSLAAFKYDGLINPNSGMISTGESTQVILQTPATIPLSSGQNGVATFTVQYDGFANMFTMTVGSIN